MSSSSSSLSPTTPTTPTARASPQPLGFTPPKHSPSDDSLSRLHVTPLPLPLPPSPSPFMKEFASTVQPPPNAVQAIFPSSTTCRFWKTVNDVRRGRVRILLLAILLTATAIVILLTSNILLLRNRFQQNSFAQNPMPIPTFPSVPVHPHLKLHHHHHRRDALAPRQQPTTTVGPSSNSTTKPTPTSSSATSTPLVIAPTIPTQNPPLPTPFPQPFDDTLSAAAFVSGSCQQFFTAFTNDINFRSCRAFSFLYAASEDFLNMLGSHATGFANVTDPIQALNNVIWGVCNTTTDQATCASRMSDYEQQLQRACKADLSQDQPLAITALNGVYHLLPLLIIRCWYLTR